MIIAKEYSTLNFDDSLEVDVIAALGKASKEGWDVSQSMLTPRVARYTAPPGLAPQPSERRYSGSIIMWRLVKQSPA
jgi:hypothetical protein